MTSAPVVLREIGTGFVGKEPHEYTGDVLRAVTALAGAELGFETCLTSRPFTACTFVPDRLGTMEQGRAGCAGAARAKLDLADGLDLLRAHGYGVRATAGLDVGPVDRDIALLWGPVAVAPRWCPYEDTLAFGGAWRYIVVEEWGADDVVGMDAVFGGETSVLRSDCPDAELLALSAPAAAIDAGELASACLRRGAGWRVAANAADECGVRDGAGLRAVAAAAPRLVSGMPAQRLRLALWSHALHALRWGAMLGALATVDTDTLALADTLARAARGCERAEHALRERDVAALRGHLEALADLEGAVTVLSGRLAAGPG